MAVSITISFFLKNISTFSFISISGLMPMPMNLLSSMSHSFLVQMQQPMPNPRSIFIGLPVLPPVGGPIILPRFSPLNVTQTFSSAENVWLLPYINTLEIRLLFFSSLIELLIVIDNV